MSHKRNMLLNTGTLALLFAVTCMAAVGGQVGGLNTFTTGTTASSADVNDNFAQVASEINDNDDRISFLEERAAGLLRGAAHVSQDGTVTRSFWNSGLAMPVITANLLSTGVYEVDFGVPIGGRFYQATLGLHSDYSPDDEDPAVIRVRPLAAQPTVLLVMITALNGNPKNLAFYAQVH